MDSANKQSAIISEVTQGTTPAGPAFLLLRDNRVSGAPTRSINRSPERRPDRAMANTYSGLTILNKTIEMAWSRDAANDVLMASLFCGAYTANIIKNASTKSFFTLEEKYEGGATDPYRRLTGCMVDSLSLSWRLGEPGSMSWSIMALAEAVATAALSGATYAVPTPQYDPVTPTDIVVNDLFSVSSPKLMGLNMTISNSDRPQHAFGSASPFGIGLGQFDVRGTAQFYLQAAADYSTFMTRQTGLILDLTIGSVASFKDRLVVSNCHVGNPDIDDPGAAGGEHLVTVEFIGAYLSSDASAAKITRLV